MWTFWALFHGFSEVNSVRDADISQEIHHHFGKSFAKCMFSNFRNKWNNMDWWLCEDVLLTVLLLVLCKGRKLNGAVLAPAPPQGDFLRNHSNSEVLWSPRAASNNASHQGTSITEVYNIFYNMRRIVKFHIVAATVIHWVYNIPVNFTTLHGHLRPESEGRKGAISSENWMGYCPFPPRPQPFIFPISRARLSKLRASAPFRPSAPVRPAPDPVTCCSFYNRPSNELATLLSPVRVF